jgi:DNA-binding response OmpR family regulator
VLYPLSYEGCGQRAYWPKVGAGTRRYAFPVAPVSVLVVDDDPVILRLLQVNFELEGIAVGLAVDGEEGLERVRTDRPDVVISDIMMPKVNGLELLAALRGEPSTAGLPVILLSAKAQVADVQRGLELGADDYVTKPFDPLELIDRVYKVLAKSRR